MKERGKIPMQTSKLLITFIEAVFEFFTYFYFFNKILQVSVTPSRIRRIISLLMIPLWLIFYNYTLLPPAFVSILIIFLLFTEKWYFTLCWTFVHTLFLNIVSNGIFYLFCIITGKIRENYYALPADFITFAFIFSAFFLLSKKIPENARPFRDLGWQGYCLISFVVLIDFFLRSEEHTSELQSH